MKIVVAPDSFKDSLSATQAANAIEAGIYTALSGAEVIKVPVADGGEGTMKTLVEALGGEYVTCLVNDPLRRQISASYGIVRSGGTPTAIIDMASASGLTLLSPAERNPLVTTSYGTGQLIADAYTRGCRHIVLGIGGSATNDAGKGMLEALGCRFLDSAGNELNPGGESLNALDFIDTSHMNPLVQACRFTIICDVDNPLYGPSGAACIFAPQKGATPHAVVTLDNGLRRFAACVEANLGKQVAQVSGAGAAGGLGAACLAFLHATLKPGIETVLETLQFSRLIDGADLIITGEGKIDRQTLMGKAPYGILLPAREKGIPVIALGGAVEDRDVLLTAGFRGIFCIQSSAMPLKRALQPHIAAENLKQTTIQIVRLLFPQE